MDFSKIPPSDCLKSPPRDPPKITPRFPYGFSRSHQGSPPIVPKEFHQFTHRIPQDSPNHRDSPLKGFSQDSLKRISIPKLDFPKNALRFPQESPKIPLRDSSKQFPQVPARIHWEIHAKFPQGILPRLRQGLPMIPSMNSLKSPQKDPPRDFLRFPQYSHKDFIYLFILQDISPSDSPKIPPRNTPKSPPRDFLKVPPGFPKDSPKNSPMFPRGIPPLIHSMDFSEILSRDFPQDSHRIPPRFHWAIPQMIPPSFQCDTQCDTLPTRFQKEVPIKGFPRSDVPNWFSRIPQGTPPRFSWKIPPKGIPPRFHQIIIQVPLWFL